MPPAINHRSHQLNKRFRLPKGELHSLSLIIARAIQFAIGNCKKCKARRIPFAYPLTKDAGIHADPAVQNPASGLMREPAQYNGPNLIDQGVTVDTLAEKWRHYDRFPLIFFVRLISFKATVCYNGYRQ